MNKIEMIVQRKNEIVRIEIIRPFSSRLGEKDIVECSGYKTEYRRAKKLLED